MTLPGRGHVPRAAGRHRRKVAASTTGAFTRLLRNLLRDPGLGPRVVPIVPDEARTFGIDALFRQSQDLRPDGQQYEPVDADLLLSYQEAADGQILEEGITEAGSMASFTAAGTAYATWGEPMIPFFIYYSMFGFHRFGDLLWAAGDMRARGFLLAATAGRTTLQGEGLQHCDGHSLLFAAAVPNLRAYDPAFAYEVAVIVRDGIARMYGADPEDLIYYLTLYNEAFPQPAMPAGVEDGILAGLYRYRAAAAERPTARGSWPAARPCSPRSRPSNCLLDDHDVAAESGARRATRRCATTRSPSSAGTGCTPDDHRTVPYVERVLEPGRARSSPSPTSSSWSPTRSPAGCRGRSSPSAPTASASPTPGRAAPPFRNGCRPHRGRRALGPGARRARCTPTSSPTPSGDTSIDPEAVDPWAA